MLFMELSSFNTLVANEKSNNAPKMVATAAPPFRRTPVGIKPSAMIDPAIIKIAVPMPFIWSPTLATSGSFFDSAPNAADIPIKAKAMAAVTRVPLLKASGSMVPIIQIAPATMRIAPAIFKKVSPMLSAYCAFLAFAISFNASEMPLAALDRAYTERTRTTLLYSFIIVSPV